jgi:hypothetical protein
VLQPGEPHERQETERFRAFPYEELIQRDKASLDIFWLKDDSLEDLENLPEPEVLAREIAENLQAALEMFSSIYEELEKGGVGSGASYGPGGIRYFSSPSVCVIIPLALSFLF